VRISEKQGVDLGLLQGLAKQVALFVAVAFLGGTLVAATIDVISGIGWSSPTLQAWALVPQVVSAAGLVYIGYRRSSRAFYILGGLIVLIVIEEAFHVLNPVSDWLARNSTWALVYGLVAFIGLLGLALSHRFGTETERPVVRNLAILLILGGIFGGPVSVVASRTNQPEWLFVEEFGEALVFAIIGGYVAGLAVRFGSKS
jgi:hypothetical protein